MTLAFHTGHRPVHSAPYRLHVSRRTIFEAIAAVVVGVLLALAAITGFGVLPLAWLDFAVIATAWAAICFIAATSYIENT
jgi:hypothetical protein